MTYGFGIVGAGMIAPYHYAAINSLANARVVGIMDNGNGHGREIAPKLDPTGAEDIDRFLAREDIDVITVPRSLLELHKAAEMTGGDPVISAHLGDVYLLLEDKQRALENYEEALALEPRQHEQPDLLGKTESLRRELGTE